MCRGSAAHPRKQQPLQPLITAFASTSRSRVISSTRALREAAKAGRTEVVLMLLDQGMDPLATDPETLDSALHEAVRFVRWLSGHSPPDAEILTSLLLPSSL